MRKFSLAAVGIAVVAAAVAAPAVASAAPSQLNAPLHGRSHSGNSSYSGNWSGYAETGSGYTSVTGTWTVPTVTPTSDDRYTSHWIGIDGDGNSDLIQLGTEADSTGGRATYSAWWEILPDYSIDIPGITPRPGDSITASITQSSSTKWKISLKDNSNGESYSATKTYNGPAASAEWIVEAPTVGGSQSAAAKFSPITFSGLTANGANPHLTTADEIILRSGSKNISTPSAPTSSGNGFTVKYTG
jgi:hypothetical protein